MPLNVTKFMLRYEKMDKMRESIETQLVDIEAAKPEFIPGTKTKRKFFDNQRKALTARLGNIKVSIRELESSYNQRYNYYATWRDKCIELEEELNNIEIELSRTILSANDIRTVLMLQAQANTPPTLEHLLNIDTLSQLNNKLAMLENKKERIRRQLSYYENKSVQVLKPLYELQAVLVEKALKEDRLPTQLHVIRDAALAHREGRVIVSNRVETESPLSILRNTPTSEVTEEVTKADHVRIEPKTPNPMDEFMKGFFNDSPKVQDNDTTEKEN